VPIGKPFSAQIELVEGCTRLCDFCGLNALRAGAGDYKRMSMKTAEATAVQLAALNPEARVEFAMHGEPTVHPQGPDVIARFRAMMPKAQIMLTTNGATFKQGHTIQDRVNRWFASGADFMVLDTYADDRADIMQALASLDSTVQIRDFYKECVPSGWSPYANHHRKFQRLIVVMDDIGERDGEHATRVLLNHAGSNPMMPALETPLEKTCTNPFREITVTWNGEVRICCMDWTGEYVCGNVHTESLGAIWYGQAFEDARAMLQNKRRDFAPCAFCNKGSGGRSGLLPKYPPVSPELVARVQGRGTPRLMERAASGASMSDALRKRLPLIK
jgi:MoaA/NifB/PqqE/SkfB family radical SAM enzyme